MSSAVGSLHGSVQIGLFPDTDGEDTSSRRMEGNCQIQQGGIRVDVEEKKDAMSMMCWFGRTHRIGTSVYAMLSPVSSDVRLVIVIFFQLHRLRA